jgi:hypothetical protein
MAKCVFTRLKGIIPMKEKIDIQTALVKLDRQILDAAGQFDQWYIDGNEYAEPSWVIETCFLQLLVLAESLGLVAFQQMLQAEYTKIASSNGGFDQSAKSPDGEPYSVVLGQIRCFKEGLACLFPDKTITEVTKDVLQILRDIHYSITDLKVFGTVPSNENDVHLRIEAILKCVFPDLKHKPMLTKQIKNFEPDTGIPSINTLIEYKYLANKKDESRIADEILADTRGYVSKDWKRFIYVIYETNRFRKESEWDQLLRESGVSESTSVVVLSGEPPRGQSKGTIKIKARKPRPPTKRARSQKPRPFGAKNTTIPATISTPSRASSPSPSTP